MQANKVYDVVMPALKLTLLRAELTDTAINTYVSRDGVEHKPLDTFPYSEILSINISPTDVDRVELCVKLKTGKKLKLISLTTGKPENGKLKRDVIDQTPEFNQWVSELHRILVDRSLSGQIEFSDGSSGKTILLVLLIVVCVGASIAAFSVRSYVAASILVVGAIKSAHVLAKMGPTNRYDPRTKILTP